MTEEIHNFKAGDRVKVFRFYSTIGGKPNLENKSSLEGNAVIIDLRPGEDMYLVQFVHEGDTRGKKCVRYVDPNQDQETI